jgi:uncharacterized phage-associated protein
MMKQKYDSVLVAKYLLSLAMEQRVVLNVTKVQKLLYIVYGYYLAKQKIQILAETPKAWPYGPVFPATRNKVNYEKILDINAPEFAEIKYDEQLTSIIKKVVEKYSTFSASQLSGWSHVKGGPWDKTTQLKGFDWNQEIPNVYISEYFSNFTI